MYFTDVFAVDPTQLSNYGALDISLICDLPLFIDPFLLFYSDKPEYQALHESIVQYVRFLWSQRQNASTQRLAELYCFKEVKETWLGFSKIGNKGSGLGLDFARSFRSNLHLLFDTSTLPSVHVEKTCLLKSGIGRDRISDFTTNLIKGFLAAYTEAFCTQQVSSSRCRQVWVPRCTFDYSAGVWSPRRFTLPFHRGSHVLLTPRDILTKDEPWINRSDLIDELEDIAAALPDAQLRSALSAFLAHALDDKSTPEDYRTAAARAIELYPQVIDHFIKSKIEHGDDAVRLSRKRVESVDALCIRQASHFVNDVLTPLGFFKLPEHSWQSAKDRALFLKDVIENKGGHRFFYVDGTAIRREEDLQLFYRLTWYSSPLDVSREVNDGRGPADFKISHGAADKTIVEFKLASNSQLRRNLEKQCPVYERASSTTHPSIKVIVYFSEAELERIESILQALNLVSSPNIVLIDARDDNKPSGSRAS